MTRWWVFHPNEDEDFCHPQHSQKASGAHPASRERGTGSSFPEHIVTIFSSSHSRRLYLQNWTLSKSRSYVTTDGQSANLSWCQAPIWDPWTYFYYGPTVGGFVDVGCPLWREDGSVVYNCCRTSLAQSFFGLSPSRIMAIFFYWFRLDTPPTWRARSPYLYPPGTGFPFRCLLRLAGQRWGYSTRLHTEWTLFKSKYVTTDGQSASLPWCQTPIWDPWPIFPLLIFRQLRVCWCGAPSLSRSRVCSLQYLLDIVSAAFLRSESHETHVHILLSISSPRPRSLSHNLRIVFHIVYRLQINWENKKKKKKFWDSPNLEGQVPVFISPRNSVAKLYPRVELCPIKLPYYHLSAWTAQKHLCKSCCWCRRWLLRRLPSNAPQSISHCNTDQGFSRP
jgi:hypothetical protein